MAAPGNDSNTRVGRARILFAVLLAGALAALSISAAAPAQDLQEKLDQKQGELDSAKDEKGLLTTEVSDYTARIDDLTGQVAALRNREAQVQIELDQAEAQLEEERRNLEILRERLQRSVVALKDRLVDIYKADEPDSISVVLDSDGFDDALGRYEYLQRIQDENADIVERVRQLRIDAQATVERIRGVVDSIAAKRAELAQTRAELETRQQQLDAARAKSERTLGKVRGKVKRLEGDVSHLNDKVQAQLLAASGTEALPSGPVQGGSAGMIWPVNGPIVSPFGTRWGRMHEGVDIAVPAGTPIRAAADGTVVLAQSEAESGGYGNFSCIDHGGGLSSCYAHQSSFAITSGSVSQGDVIGYVGCTGHCYGDHLHYEVRVNGAPTDPMGYL